MPRKIERGSCNILHCSLLAHSRRCDFNGLALLNVAWDLLSLDRHWERHWA